MPTAETFTKSIIIFLSCLILFHTSSSKNIHFLRNAKTFAFLKLSILFCAKCYNWLLVQTQDQLLKLLKSVWLSVLFFLWNLSYSTCHYMKIGVSESFPGTRNKRPCITGYPVLSVGPALVNISTKLYFPCKILLYIIYFRCSFRSGSSSMDNFVCK